MAKILHRDDDALIVKMTYDEADALFVDTEELKDGATLVPLIKGGMLQHLRTAVKRMDLAIEAVDKAKGATG